MAHVGSFLAIFAFFLDFREYVGLKSSFGVIFFPILNRFGLILEEIWLDFEGFLKHCSVFFCISLENCDFVKCSVFPRANQ